MSEENLLWRETDRKEVVKCRVFSIVQTQRSAADGRSGSFYFMHSPDWVNIVPLTVDEKGRECFLMVKQFRQGLGQVTVEFPGGIVDPDESPREAAERELREETGCRPQELVQAGVVCPNPAIMDNWVYTFIAPELEQAGEQETDDDEIVNLLKVPVETVRREMGRGQYINGVIMNALFWFERWRQ